MIGIMADFSVDMSVLQFSLNDAVGVVDLLEELYLRGVEEA